MSIERRRMLMYGVGGAVAAGVYLAGRPDTAATKRRPAASSPVAILKAASYEVDLADVIRRGIAAVGGLDVRGKRVLLKPNLVEFDRNTCINTDPRVVVAAIEVFESLGAAAVVVAEGPGHRRDTFDLAEQAAYRSSIQRFEDRFVDLNRDDVSLVRAFHEGDDFYFPNEVLRADLIVSLAKMKTHHWAGATLSMKNFFGVVPGSVYGWPKNQLHFYGIDTSIVALHRQFAKKSFAIVDGIVGMEGNGPIQGTPKHAGVIVLGRDLPAVDSTCCRVMGIDPLKIQYLVDSEEGDVDSGKILQRGELVRSVRTEFSLTSDFRHLRATNEG